MPTALRKRNQKYASSRPLLNEFPKSKQRSTAKDNDPAAKIQEASIRAQLILSSCAEEKHYWSRLLRKFILIPAKYTTEAGKLV